MRWRIPPAVPRHGIALLRTRQFKVGERRPPARSTLFTLAYGDYEDYQPSRARLNLTLRRSFCLQGIANSMNRSSALLCPLNTLHVQPTIRRCAATPSTDRNKRDTP